jgi:branched-chain amino acid transport system ATP-binding protein
MREVFRVVASAAARASRSYSSKQNVRAATEIADRAYVLDDGRVVFSGAAGEFARDEARVRALAGASADA